MDISFSLGYIHGYIGYIRWIYPRYIQNDRYVIDISMDIHLDISWIFLGYIHRRYIHLRYIYCRYIHRRYIHRGYIIFWIYLQWIYPTRYIHKKLEIFFFLIPAFYKISLNLGKM